MRRGASGCGRARNGRARGTLQLYRPHPSAVVRFDLEGELLAEGWAYPVLWKRGNMDKNLLPALGRRDESETAVVIPFRERACNAHEKCPTSATARGKLRPERARRPQFGVVAGGFVGQWVHFRIVACEVGIEQTVPGAPQPCEQGGRPGPAGRVGGGSMGGCSWGARRIGVRMVERPLRISESAGLGPHRRRPHFGVGDSGLARRSIGLPN
jgi:hypothetical protein